MINAWSLLHDVLNGKLDEEYPIMNKKDTKVTPLESDEYDPITTLGGESSDTISITGDDEWLGVGAAEEIKIDTSGHDVVTFGVDTPPAGFDTLNFGTPFPGGMGEDHINFNTGLAGTQWNDNKYYATGYDPYPTAGGVDTLNLNSKTKPQPDLKYKSQKYQEDKGIADLKDYVSSTYQGHYTNENSDVQTLDLIHSVGDAESFCRSNALKYLSRYDKKGSAKNDILKAMHYCLLLYYFSGNTQDPDYTNTRYETF